MRCTCKKLTVVVIIAGYLFIDPIGRWLFYESKTWWSPIFYNIQIMMKICFELIVFNKLYENVIELVVRYKRITVSFFLCFSNTFSPTRTLTNHNTITEFKIILFYLLYDFLENTGIKKLYTN